MNDSSALEPKIVQRKNLSSHILYPQSLFEPILAQDDSSAYKEVRVRCPGGNKRRISVPLKTVPNPVTHLQRLNRYDPSMKKREANGVPFQLSNPLDCIEEEKSKKSKPNPNMISSKSLSQPRAKVFQIDQKLISGSFEIVQPRDQSGPLRQIAEDQQSLSSVSNSDDEEKK